MRNIVIIGGSDVGISAALRIRELDQDTQVTSQITGFQITAYAASLFIGI